VQTIKAQERDVFLTSNIMQMRLQIYTRKREEFLLIQLAKNNYLHDFHIGLKDKYKNQQN